MGTTATTLTGAINEVKTETRPVDKGGTGATSFTSNAVLYGNGLNAIGAKASANGALYATAADGALSWGTLPVGQGGTGLTASPSMLTNLGSTSAANVLATSPRPGVTGTLPIANGGTGETQVRATTSTDVVTASSGWSVSSVQYAWWGKVATMKITFKKNSTAITTATTVTFGTLAEGYRPRYDSPGIIGWGGNVIVESGGAIKNNGTFNANTEYTVYSTFVLGNTSM